MSVDHASAVAAPKSDPVFLHVKAGMTVIVTDTEGAWRMADVIWVDGGARNPKVRPHAVSGGRHAHRRHQLDQRRPRDSHLPQGLAVRGC